MPLAFSSISHGEIAFGFFNIDTDMLLLEHYFLFADQFCENVSDMARSDDFLSFRGNWEIYAIQQREEIGDLMGAIHGIRFTGFIGDVYRQYPFPQKPEDFKQKPDGHKNRDSVKALIADYSIRSRVPVAVKGAARELQIGDYLFSFSTFQELIEYVWRGGYPQWKNEERPAYVLAMQKALPGSRSPLFNTIDL
jgi:hypothetical protein